ncbi:MAG: hypothetical protein LWW98_06255 [Deltaproteobacteria bacterium]|nr:hypothetical protein [Deltaproteobacteria bacterium]
MNKKFLSTGKTANSEKGALLLSVIVIIVIFSVLGAAILSITSTSTFTQVYSNHATKAYYMAESGYRYATMNIMTISVGGDDCLKCHSSHGKETIRYSAGYGILPDDTIKVHGKYPKAGDEGLLDGGSFKIALAPFWFKAESLVDNNLTVSAIAHSSGDPQCDFPEAFPLPDDTVGGLRVGIGGQYVRYNKAEVPGDGGNGTLTFTVVDPDPDSISLSVGDDIFPACRVEEDQTLSKGGDLKINTTTGFYAFPNTKSVIKINNKLITYEHVDVDNGILIGLGDVDGLDPVVAGLEVKADDIVTLSKTLKITSTGIYPDADENAAVKTLEYYRWVGKPMTVPIVYNTAEPGKDPDTNEFLMLAGGNFHWVSDDGGNDDTKGHNVLGISSGLESNLEGGPPGQADGFLPGCRKCHKGMAGYEKRVGEIKEGAGCKACHLVPHPDDTDTPGDKYCFLRGGCEDSGVTGKGVTGIKDKKDKDGNEAEDGSDGDWQYSKSSSDHNEYRGIAGDVGKGFTDYPHTTTGYCTGCHGKFHSEQKSGEDWIRHPSDWVIPLETDINKKFGDAFDSNGTGKGIYDPDLPVARPNIGTFGWTAPDSSVYLGEDMVMCLSCHVAHGSQYSDMLRWDYDDMIVGTTGAGQGKGCFKCHTDKDGFDSAGQHCGECHTIHDTLNGDPVTPTADSEGRSDGAYPHLLNTDSPKPTKPHP